MEPTFDDLTLVDDGLRITIRQSKTDQEGAGQVIAILTDSLLFCPVTAVMQWLLIASIEAGPIFRAVGKGGRIDKTAVSDKSLANLSSAMPDTSAWIPPTSLLIA
ncbi:MAG: hypothetical protein ABL919_05795 [Methylococcales bacterium]|nr:hypothetical protein [Methylococcaceae bacterium]